MYIPTYTVWVWWCTLPYVCTMSVVPSVLAGCSEAARRRRRQSIQGEDASWILNTTGWAELAQHEALASPAILSSHCTRFHSYTSNANSPFQHFLLTIYSLTRLCSIRRIHVIRDNLTCAIWETIYTHIFVQ